MKSRVLVTGGAGFIGSHLVDALIGAGYDVRILDCLVAQVHPSGRPAAYLNPRAELVVGNVCDTAAVESALEGVEAVFHMAADVGVGQSMQEIERYVRNNSLGMATLLGAVSRRPGQVRKLVVPSSVSLYGEGTYDCARCGVVYPDLRTPEQMRAGRWEVCCPTCGLDARPRPTPETRPLNPGSVYAVTKQDQEQLSLIVGRTYGIPTVALRYYNVYGPRQAAGNPYTGVCAILLDWLMDGEIPRINEDGEQTRDFVHVRDVVAANLRALETSGGDGQVFNVGTGRGVSIRSVVRLLSAALGNPVEPDVAGRFRDGDVRHSVADISRARACLGFEPMISFEDGIHDLVAWGRQRREVGTLGSASR